MRLVIFGGTTEGRKLSHWGAEKGADVTVCVATEYGCEEQGTGAGITVLTGRRPAREIERIVCGCDLCVDATHPYAVRATEEIRMACRAAEVPYERLLRGKSAELDDAILVESAAQAAEILAGVTGNVLITTGSKELQAYAALPRERLYPRVLPSGESLAACEAIEIPHRNIIAMQGPFTKELNAALIRQFHIVWLVTKDGGQAGGFAEKVQAVRETGIRLIVLCRPQEQGKSFAEIVEICEEMMRCR